MSLRGRIWMASCPPGYVLYLNCRRWCRECREYLATYRRRIEVGREARSVDEALPDDVPEDLIKAILEAHDL
jgi:hypothetical protein